MGPGFGCRLGVKHTKAKKKHTQKKKQGWVNKKKKKKKKKKKSKKKLSGPDMFGQATPHEVGVRL